MSYVGRAGRAPAQPSRLALLPFLGVGILLSAARVLATTAAATPTPAGINAPIQLVSNQTWLFAVIWIASYLVEAIAGWLLWRRRTQPYGRAAMITFWVLLVLQALRLLNLLGSRLTAGQVPWSAFGTVVLLDVVAVVATLTAWQVSKRAGGILVAVLAWLLFVTALTGADALLQYGLPLT